MSKNSKSSPNLSPASCWSTQKKIENWARLARDRTLGSISPTFLQTFDNDNDVEIHIATGHKKFFFSGAIKSSREFQQLPVAQSSSLQHQSCSLPITETSTRHSDNKLTRTISVCTNTSFTRQYQHRSSSPQIRPYSVDQSPPQSLPPMSLSSGTSSMMFRTNSPNRYQTFDQRAASLSSSVTMIGNSAFENDASSVSQLSLNSIGSNQTVSNTFRSLTPLLHPTKTDLNIAVTPVSPIGNIQPDLYQKHSEPMYLKTQAISGPSLGRLHFKLKFDLDRSDFIIEIIEAQNLFEADQGGFSEPFLKIQLIPEVDTKKRQTDVYRNDKNPQINEVFKFPVAFEELKEKTLQLLMFDNERNVQKDIVGEIRINIEELELLTSMDIWTDIIRSKRAAKDRKELLVSLNYLPSAERLTIIFLQGRNLLHMHSSNERETVDAFIKVYLSLNGKRIKKKKSTVQKHCKDPVWNEAFTFSISSVNMRDALIEEEFPRANFYNTITDCDILVMDQGNDLVGHNLLIGSCRIGPREVGISQDHWISMIQNPRKSIHVWHILR